MIDTNVCAVEGSVVLKSLPVVIEPARSNPAVREDIGTIQIQRESVDVDIAVFETVDRI